MVGKIRAPKNLSVKKFNIDFLKKARNLFASLTNFSYLWGVKQLNKSNYDNDFNDFKRD